jgi:hypothetical protein
MAPNRIKNYQAWFTHKQEMLARKARRAERTGGQYDRTTARSAIRSVMRKLAGRWDGKPKAAG